MHIKQIIIKGFKTYREQVIIGPLSAKDNVFVGLNGHGKSNFFNAIMFVFSDKFSNIRNEDKVRLIHEGAAESVNAASVEIILDNSDGRLPVDKTSVSIKRILKSNKDEYFIDGKHVTKADVNNLLESAGFSKANPYYVVQQGRVASLAAMNENQCLELLKEVAGTIVYDERKAESEKLLEETRRKRGKIGEIMERIEERIRELEGESDELKKYQQIEKSRRALEYILYKNHVLKSQESIEAIELSQADLLDKINSLKLNKNNLQEDIDTYENEVTNRSSMIQKIQFSLQTLEENSSRYHNKKSQLENQIHASKERQNNVSIEKLKCEKEIKALEEEKNREEGLLAQLKPRFDQLKDQEQHLMVQLHNKQRRKDQLFAKQGSKLRFKSIDERNHFLSTEISALENHKTETKKQELAIINELKNDHKRVTVIENNVPIIEQQVNEEKRKIDDCVEKIGNIKQSRSKNAVDINRLRGEEEALTNHKEQTEAKMAQCAHRLQMLLPGQLFSTIEKLKTACAHLSGYYGILLDLINIPAKFQTCADIASKLKCFAIIVDTFDTAKEVLDMNAKMGGERINIYPVEWLHELNIKDRNYPSGSDSIPLLKQIKAKENAAVDLSPIVKYIFGKTILVRNQDVANRYAKDYNLHCVTPDGQMVYSGAYMVRAGFHDIKKERIRVYSELAKLREELQGISQNLYQIRLQKDQTASQDTELQRQFQNYSSLKDNSNSKLQALKATEQALKQEKYEISRKISDKEKLIELYKNEMANLTENIENVMADREKKEVGDLSPQETMELENLLNELEGLEKETMNISNQRLDLQNQLEQYQIKLSHFIPQKYSKLLEKLEDCNIVQQARDRKELEDDYAQLARLAENAEEQVKAASQELRNSITQSRDLNENVKVLKEKQQRIMTEVTEMQIKADKISLKHAHLQEIKDDYIKKMGSLGSLPAEEHEKFRNEPPRELMRLLEENSKEMQKYMHVNKRALEQYSRFTDRIQSLRERIQDLDASEKSIQELLTHLDGVKDEAIVRTFRSVAKYFGEVFHEIVPQGKGKLKMIKGEGEGVEKYLGVSISVSFSRNDDSIYKMQQLSGGQKTAVAIALIIAIQRADPAPFYLFDELDAALDTQLRNSLAGVINRSAERAQFIMTTFKPELCKNANKIFEVKFKNKASTIHLIDRQKALEIIQQAAQEPRASNDK